MIKQGLRSRNLLVLYPWQARPHEHGEEILREIRLAFQGDGRIVWFELGLRYEGLLRLLLRIAGRCGQPLLVPRIYGRLVMTHRQ
jgi:hypothetical protein